MVRRYVAVGVFSVGLAAVAVALSPDDGSAIVSGLRGSATVQEPGKPPRRAQTYDWIAENATITVAERSSVVLVLATGERFELSENARVTVLRAGLPTSGTVRALPAFPPVPSVPPIEGSSTVTRRTGTAGTVSGAVRIRGSSISNLYPSDNAAIADKTTLRFRGSNGSTAFLVVVEDEKRVPVFNIRTARGEVAVPPGVLGAGRPYYWHVTVADDSVPAAAEAVFTTLPASAVQARDAFAASLRLDTADHLALLALIDQRLGLLMEARDELTDAARRAPGDREVRRMLARIRSQLGESTLDGFHP